MNIYPEYAKNIVTGVIFNGLFQWYVTDKSCWYLDLNQLDRAYESIGMGRVLRDKSVVERFGISVVDHTNAESFLHFMKPYAVEVEELAALVERLGDSGDPDELIDVSPSLLVSFDLKTLKSMYPEPESFEDFVPDGWAGYRVDFTEDVPYSFRYWIINGRNYFDVT